MTIRVLLFGHYRDVNSRYTRPDGFVVEVAPGATAADLADDLARQDRNLSDLLARTRVAVNAEFASPQTPLCANDEVAFLPPMSGG